MGGNLSGKGSESTSVSLRGLEADRDIVGPHRGRQGGLAHEVRVDGRGGRTALRDRPHDERLPASRIARDEHAGGRRVEVALALEVAAARELRAELLLDEGPL